MPRSTPNQLRPVTSAQNALVKELRRAFQRSELTADGHAAIEGVRTIEEAIRSGLHLKAVFFSEAAQTRAEALLPQLSKHAETLLLPDKVFENAVATETPQGVAALVKVRAFKLPDVLKASSEVPVLVAERIQDPGNLGTLLRSAEALGASGVLLTEGTVSLYNPKTLRASAGSIFRLPTVRISSEKAIQGLREHGLRLVGTTSHSGAPLDEASLAGPVAIFLGNEGAGLPKTMLRQMDTLVEIPHAGKVESLNAAVAGSIILYEAARQRRGMGLET
jgi:TrmH family RNA methyltransferase